MQAIKNNLYLYYFGDAKASPIKDALSSALESIRSVATQSMQSGTALTQKAIEHLNDFEMFLDVNIPDNFLQKKLDSLGSLIDKKLSCFPHLHKWLDSSDYQTWKYGFALFLAKLPLRSARNIIRCLYNTISAILYTAVHPLKGATKAAKYLVLMVEELAKPKNLAKIGASIAGASFGQFLGTCNANPFSFIGLGIGISMIVAGVSFDLIKTAIESKENILIDLRVCLEGHVKQLPEAAVTGFFMGLLLGGIQRAVQGHEQQALHVTNQATAQEWGNLYAQSHGIPAPDHIFYNSNGTVTLYWNHPVHGWLEGQSSSVHSVSLDPSLAHQIDIFRNELVTDYGSIGAGFLANSALALSQEPSKEDKPLSEQEQLEWVKNIMKSGTTMVVNTAEGTYSTFMEVAGKNNTPSASNLGLSDNDDTVNL